MQALLTQSGTFYFKDVSVKEGVMIKDDQICSSLILEIFYLVYSHIDVIVVTQNRLLSYTVVGTIRFCKFSRVKKLSTLQLMNSEALLE